METIYPIFKKDNAYVYKIISDSLLVQIYLNGFNGACQINYLDNDLIAAYVIQKETISESEFLDNYYQVRKRLNQLCDINFDLL